MRIFYYCHHFCQINNYIFINKAGHNNLMRNLSESVNIDVQCFICEKNVLHLSCYGFNENQLK